MRGIDCFCLFLAGFAFVTGCRSIPAHDGSREVKNMVKPSSINDCIALIDSHLTEPEKAKIRNDPNYGGTINISEWIHANCLKNNDKLKRYFEGIGLTEDETISNYIYTIYANKLMHVAIDEKQVLENAKKAQKYRTSGVPRNN
jgi:hypothetical protein